MAAKARRGAGGLAVVGVCGLLVGCGLVHKFTPPHSVSLADRCADFMKAAFPSAAIDIEKRESTGTGIDTVVAHVEGVRDDIPADGTLAHDLAVECRFDGNVLTGFGWTKGPLH